MPDFTPAQHRFFDQLVSFLVGAVGGAVAVQAQGRRRTEGFKQDEAVLFQGRPAASNVQLRFYPGPVLQAIAEGKWPASVRYDEEPLPVPPPTLPHRIRGFGRLHVTMIQSAFVQHFESVRDQIEARHGGDPYRWPQPLNFARVLRNAFAHGGQIDIRSATAPPVVWRGLWYTVADNGRSVLYQDMAPADVIVLMREVDSAV